MVTLEMVQFGRAMAAKEIALFNMEVSFKQPMDSDKLRAMDHFNTQCATQVGFWCDWDDGDGAVLMICGGGTYCGRADHGIALTEANRASFLEGSQLEYDFGNEAMFGATSIKTYSLNLWIN